MLDVWVPQADVLFEAIGHTRSEVSVAVSLYNYGATVIDALESARGQDLADLDLLVVDDGSADGGERRVLHWMRAHGARFGRCLLLRHAANEGLAAARNQAFAAAGTAYVFVLDADNELYPRCLGACLAAARVSGADAAYTLLEIYGGQTGVMGTDLWDPEALRAGNYIDAMALIRRGAWQQVGGYRRMPVGGWEDYDLWLKFAEAGLEAIRLPEILGRYRTGHASMIRRLAGDPQAMAALTDDIRRHHPGAHAARLVAGR